MYYYNHKVNRDSKLDVTSVNGVFVGIERNNASYYRVYDTTKNKIIITKDIKFFDKSLSTVKKLNIDGTLKDDELDREINKLAPSDDYISDDYSAEQLAELFGENDNNEQVSNENGSDRNEFNGKDLVNTSASCFFVSIHSGKMIPSLIFSFMK